MTYQIFEAMLVCEKPKYMLRQCNSYEIMHQPCHLGCNLHIIAAICTHIGQIPLNQPLPHIDGLLFMDFDYVTLTSQKPCKHNNKLDCSHNDYAIAIFFGKKSTSFILLIIRIIDFNRAEPTCYRTNFHCVGEQNGAFWYIVIRIRLLTYTRAMI